MSKPTQKEIRTTIYELIEAAKDLGAIESAADYEWTSSMPYDEALYDAENKVDGLRHQVHVMLSELTR